MTKVIALSFFIFSFVFCACDDEATVGAIHGTLRAGEGLEEISLNAIDVYLYETLGPYTVQCVDSVKTNTDDKFSFSNLEFKTYVVNLKHNFNIIPDPDFIDLDVDHAVKTVIYEVQAIEDSLVVN